MSLSGCVNRLYCYRAPPAITKRGLTQNLRCAQKSTFNTWQPRGVVLNLDTAEIVLYTAPESAVVLSAIPLISIALVDRMKRDDKTVVLRFRRSGAKECVLRFEEQADRDKFCTEAHLLSSDLVFSDEGHWMEGATGCCTSCGGGVTTTSAQG